MKKIIMFPGQGSQKTGMGEALLERYAEVVKEADTILGYSVRDMILSEENEAKLNQTKFTQPMLYLVNGLSWRALQEDGKGGADVFIGHSLGEYNALQAAGSFDLLTGIRIVKKRAELMASEGGSEGGMAAVLGLDDGEVESLVNREEGVEVANYNSNGQVVLSGLKESLSKLETPFKEMGARRFLMLPVSGAFHSQYMKTAASKFEEFLVDFSLSRPQMPVYSNVDTVVYGDRPVSELLVEQIYSSVRWRQMVGKLKTEIFSGEECEFQEVGPGNVLTGLVKRI